MITLGSRQGHEEATSYKSSGKLEDFENLWTWTQQLNLLSLFIVIVMDTIYTSGHSSLRVYQSRLRLNEMTHGHSLTSSIGEWYNQLNCDDYCHEMSCLKTNETRMRSLLLRPLLEVQRLVTVRCWLFKVTLVPMIHEQKILTFEARQRCRLA